MEKWCFFSVGEVATSKWTHGEVAVLVQRYTKFSRLNAKSCHHQCKRGYARSGTYVCQQKVENRPKKRCPLKAPEKLWFIEWSLKVEGRQRKRGRWSYLPSIWTDYLHNLKAAQNGYMEKWCFFFRRWGRNLEMDTWRSGCFWFYCIQNFRA